MKEDIENLNPWSEPKNFHMPITLNKLITSLHQFRQQTCTHIIFLVLIQNPRLFKLRQLYIIFLAKFGYIFRIYISWNFIFIFVGLSVTKKSFDVFIIKWYISLYFIKVKLTFAYFSTFPQTWIWKITSVQILIIISRFKFSVLCS